KGGVAAGCLHDFDDICALAGSTSISCAGSRSFHYGIASSPVDPMLFERCFAPWVVQATSPRSLARQKTQEKRQNAPKARKPGRSCLKPPAQNRPGFLAVKGSRGRLISCSCRRLKGAHAARACSLGSRDVWWPAAPGPQGKKRKAAALHDLFLPARRTARSCVARPSLITCRARPKASESAGTSRVITEPEAT